jgi:tRNA nucleotidyltransferase (CCA-adding enzyme)
MDSLAQERIYSELCKLLECARAEDLIRYAPVIVQVIPELAASVGFEQHNPHHSYDVYTHTAHVVENTPPELSLRWAALLHDSGKPATFTLDENGCGHFYDHAPASAQIADTVLQRLRAPTALRQQVVALIQRHMTPLETDKKILRRRLGSYGIEGTLDLLALQQADFLGKGTKEETDHFSQVVQMIHQIQQEDACLSVKDLAINGSDLISLGFTPGPTIRHCLESLLLAIQDETLTNQKEALLEAASAYLLGGIL